MSPTVWWCGWCKGGPHSLFYAFCYFCHRQRDSYAKYETDELSNRENAHVANVSANLVQRLVPRRESTLLQPDTYAGVSSGTTARGDATTGSLLYQASYRVLPHLEGAQPTIGSTEGDRQLFPEAYHDDVEALDVEEIEPQPSSGTDAFPPSIHGTAPANLPVWRDASISHFTGHQSSVPSESEQQERFIESAAPFIGLPQPELGPEIGNRSGSQQLPITQSSNFVPIDDIFRTELPPQPIRPGSDLGPQESIHRYLHGPRSYYEKLRKIRGEVYQYSAIASLSSDTLEEHLTLPELVAGQGPEQKVQAVDCDLFEYDRQPTPDFSKSVQLEIIKKLESYRNIIMTVCANINRLQNSGFIQGQMSILAIDGDRSEVINMVPVPIKVINDLAYSFDRAVKCVKGRDFGDSRLGYILGTLTRACHRVLLSLHLSGIPLRTDILKDIYTPNMCVRFWHDAVLLMDLAVLFYAGAHVDPLPGQMLEEYERKFNSGILHGIYIHQQPLKCMGGLFGDRKVWTFSLHPVSSHRQLYVSAAADTIANIWGPMWEVHETHNNSILQYNVGNGSIIPWKYEVLGGHPHLKDGERLAHWTPVGLTSQGSTSSETGNPWHPGEHTLGNAQSEDEDSSESEPDGQVETFEVDSDDLSQWAAYAKANPFSGSEQLLIGAQKSPKLEWNSCHCSTQKFTHQLKELRRLQFLETSKLFRYVDARTINMTAGSHSLTLGANITIKTQNGRSWKKVLLEVWENQPESRHPRTLESFWGVCISLCNRNAQRVRMIELLRTESIRQLLKPFCWSDNRIKEEFYSAISSTDPFALCTIWEKEEQWQEELGRVLLTCMRALCQTGYDDDREEFYALWMSSKSSRPKKVTLDPAEHSWIRLLRDSEDSCATAVVVKECFGSISADNRVQRCRHDGGWSAPSRLETAIVINHKISDPLLITRNQCQGDMEEWRSADRLWKTSWDVSDIKQGHKFWMSSPHARLNTIQRLSSSHLLLEWDTVKRDKLRQIVGLDPCDRPGHWEYTEDGDHPPVRPIPVHVQTNT